MANITLILLFLVIWTIYSALEGLLEAIFYHLFVKDPVKIIYHYGDLHKYYVVRRLIILTTLCIAIYGISIKGGTAFVGGMLMFSMIHNGVFYITRNTLDNNIYKKRFKAESTTSTAFWEFSYPTRLILFIAGICQIISILFI